MMIFLSVASGSQDIPHKDKGQHSESNMEWSVWGKDFGEFVVPCPKNPQFKGNKWYTKIMQ